jgi:hypothetical protein
MFGREMALVFESYVGEASRVREYLEKDFDGMGAEEAGAHPDGLHGGRRCVGPVSVCLPGRGPGPRPGSPPRRRGLPGGRVPVDPPRAQMSKGEA